MCFKDNSSYGHFRNLLEVVLVLVTFLKFITSLSILGRERTDHHICLVTGLQKFARKSQETCNFMVRGNLIYIRHKCYHMPVFEIAAGVKCSQKNRGLNFSLIPFMCKNKRIYNDNFIMICSDTGSENLTLYYIVFEVSPGPILRQYNPVHNL